MSKVEIKKEKVIQAIAFYLINEGLADVGIRKLAAVSDTSDRMLIYYFGTKDGLIGEVLTFIAGGLTSQLDAVLGEHQRDAAQLIEEVYALREVPEFMSAIRLWFEIVGHAVRKEEPYATYAKTIGWAWIDWIDTRLSAEQKDQTIATFAEIEGRLMFYLIEIEP